MLGTRLTIAAAIGLLVIAYGLAAQQPVRRRLLRAALGLSGCLFTAHLAMAFHEVHHWSHAAALAHTALRTEEVVGLRWGGGLYVNYICAVVWIALCCRGEIPVSAPKTWFRTVESAAEFFVAFMIFQATVVFGGLLARELGAAALIALAVAWAKRRKRPPGSPTRLGIASLSP
jgi:hypothetical protein